MWSWLSKKKEGDIVTAEDKMMEYTFNSFQNLSASEIERKDPMMKRKKKKRKQRKRKTNRKGNEKQ